MADLFALTFPSESNHRAPSTWTELAASAWSEVKANPGKSAALSAMALTLGALELYSRLRGKPELAKAIEKSVQEIVPKIEKAAESAAPHMVAEWSEGPWGTKSIDAAKKTAASMGWVGGPWGTRAIGLARQAELSAKSALPSFDHTQKGFDAFLKDGRNADASALISTSKPLDFSSDIAARANKMREQDLKDMHVRAQMPFDLFKRSIEKNTQDGRFVQLDPVTHVGRIGRLDFIMRSDEEMTYIRLRNGEHISLQGIDHTTGESRMYSVIPRGSGMRGGNMVIKISPRGKVTSELLESEAEQFSYEHDHFIASANHKPVYPVLGKMK